MKNLFGLFSHLFSALEITNLTDPNQQFSASFRAANSRQVKTRNIPFKGNTKETTI
jgi:hypothetical protein